MSETARPIESFVENETGERRSDGTISPDKGLRVDLE